jgi:hypothetical protein
MASFVDRITIFGQTGKGARRTLASSCGVILNEVKDLTLGVGLLKPNRVAYDGGRGPALRSG